MRIDHLDENLLFEFVDRGVTNSGFQHHIRQCGLCRSRFADTLVLVGGLRSLKGESKPDGLSKHPSDSFPDLARPLSKPEKEQTVEHVYSSALSSFLAAAYEWEAADERFFSTASHLLACSTCFSEFLRISKELAPNVQTIKKIANSIPKRTSPVSSVGSLEITKYMDAFYRAFRSEPEEKEPSEGIGREQFAEGEAPLFSLESRRPDIFDISLDGLVLTGILQGSEDSPELQMEILDSESKLPVPGVVLDQEDSTGFLMSSEKTDQDGRAILKMNKQSTLIKVKHEERIWPIELELDSFS